MSKSSPRPKATRQHHKAANVGQYTRPLAKWPHYRAKIRRLYREVAQDIPGFTDRHRALLAQCVFEVANDIEHKHAYKTEKPPVVDVIFGVMNRLYDDLGWNENLEDKAIDE